MADRMSLQEQANAILEKAQERGISTNFFFVTTFKRYQVQMQILTSLEKAINAEGAMVEKEYVKGRKNLYTNPAIQEYNRTTTAANNTVITLIKIVEGFVDDAAGTESKLGQFLRSLED
jgi:hypothetical protein